MSTAAAISLAALCLSAFAFSSNLDDTCVIGGSASVRAGSALVQSRSDVTGREPFVDQQDGIALTTQMLTMEERVTQLETASDAGREDLKNQATKLKESFEAFKNGGSGSLEDTISRVSSAEAKTSTLEETANTGNQDVRAEMKALRDRYEVLASRVGGAAVLLQSNPSTAKKLTHSTAKKSTLSTAMGQSASSPHASMAKKKLAKAAILQSEEDTAADADSEASAADAAAAPDARATLGSSPVAASGDPLLGRCDALEKRVYELETVSDQGRDDLLNEVDALDAEIETVRATGGLSLDHTIVRQGSAEKHVASLQDANAAETEAMRNELEALEAKLGSMSKHLRGAAAGAALLQEKADPAAPAASSNPAALSLRTRMDALRQRIEQLETKSGEGRGELQVRLTDLTAKLDGMKKTGTSSLTHTVVRVTATENDISALEGSVATAKTTLMELVESLKSKLDALEQHVGQAS